MYSATLFVLHNKMSRLATSACWEWTPFKHNVLFDIWRRLTSHGDESVRVGTTCVYIATFKKMFSHRTRRWNREKKSSPKFHHRYYYYHYYYNDLADTNLSVNITMSSKINYKLVLRPVPTQYKGIFVRSLN